MSKKTYTQLSESERQAIALGREQKLSLSAIARALGRHKSTISRECTRNAGGNGYNVKYAHQRSIRRKRFARPSPKLHRDGPLYPIVCAYLRQKWSPEQIAQAAWDTVPPVAPLFWSFRLMVAIGMFLIVLMGTFLVLSAKHQLGERRWLLKVALWSLPLPWLAVEAGWIVAELGRQPWVIEGVLPTAVAVSNLGVKTLLLTIAGFVAIYSVLLVIEIKLMLKTIRKGPQETPAPAPTPLTARAAAPLAPAH